MWDNRSAASTAKTGGASVTGDSVRPVFSHCSHRSLKPLLFEHSQDRGRITFCPSVYLWCLLLPLALGYWHARFIECKWRQHLIFATEYILTLDVTKHRFAVWISQHPLCDRHYYPQERTEAGAVTLSVSIASKWQKQDSSPGRPAAPSKVEALCSVAICEVTTWTLVSIGDFWHGPLLPPTVLQSYSQWPAMGYVQNVALESTTNVQQTLYTVTGQTHLWNVNCSIMLTLSDVFQSHLFLSSPWSASQRGFQKSQLAQAGGGRPALTS